MNKKSTQSARAATPRTSKTGNRLEIEGDAHVGRDLIGRDQINNLTIILNMGNATLEIFDETQAKTIDQIEAGQRISGQIRFALQVPDLKAAMERLLAHGATLIHPPIITSWGDYNVRLQDPDGMQITLFQILDHNEQGK